MKYLSILLCTALFLTGCISTEHLDVSKMVITKAQAEKYTHKKIKNTIYVSKISAGDLLKMHENAESATAAFSQAVKKSLAKVNQLAANKTDAKYILSAEIIAISKPETFGEARVDATVIYTLANNKNERIVYQKAHGSTGIATLSESINPLSRGKSAAEQAVRNNIVSLLSDLKKQL